MSLLEHLIRAFFAFGLATLVFPVLFLAMTLGFHAAPVGSLIGSGLIACALAWQVL